MNLRVPPDVSTRSVIASPAAGGRGNPCHNHLLRDDWQIVIAFDDSLGINYERLMTNAYCLEPVGRVPSPPLAEEKPDTTEKMPLMKAIKQACL